jgi:hypothetical protein
MRPTIDDLPPIAVWGTQRLVAVPGGSLPVVPAAAGDGPVDPNVTMTLWLRNTRFYTDTALTTLSAADDDPVRGWEDESAHASNFTSASFFPDYAESYAASKPAAVFNSANFDFLAGPNTNPIGYFGVTGFTAYLVFKPSTISADEGAGNKLIAHAGIYGENFTLGLNKSDQVYVSINWGTLGTVTTTTAAVLQCVRFRADTSALTVRVNDGDEVSAAWANASDLATLDGYLILGNNFGQTNGFDGGMFEIIILDHPVTADEDAAIYDNYLALKYGL